MAITRRTLLRRTAILGLVPASQYLIGCSDDAKGDSDVGTDTGLDASADVATDTDVEEPLPELPEYEYDGPLGPEDLFAHGVASGDPLTDAVILWTHVSPAEEGPVEVWYEVSLDAAFTRRVQVGTHQTDASADYTVKLDARELAPGRTYYYRFMALGRTSPIGRTRTAPEGGVSRLRFGMASCASFGHGYYHAYRRLAERADLDCILHLGDYIYEYATGGYGSVRELDPPYEIVSLDDYRRRYRHHRKDLDLQAVHQQHPFITVWDDHESTNDSWKDGAENHQPATEGDWADRKAASVQAYNEWMPIRTNMDEEGRIFRAFEFGDLVDLIMLDTRLWGRDEPAGRTDNEVHADPTRTLLGDDQEEWLYEELRTSSARWKLIGQQVMIAQWRGAPASPDEQGPIFNADQWDGYAPSRDRLFQTIVDNAIDDVVVLTGDIHTSWGNDLALDPYDPEVYDPATGSGSIAVEIVTPGITSPGLEGGSFIGRFLQDINKHVKFVDLERRGYVVLDITAERMQAEWYLLDGVDTLETEENLGAVLATVSGSNHLVSVDAPSTPPISVPEPAPEG